MLTRIVVATLAALVIAPSATGSEQLLTGLHANGPYAPQAEQMAAFGRFIGDWDLVVEYQQDDGSWQGTVGEWHFGWILQGRAIQDVWTVYRPGAKRGDATQIMGYGTTVRVFDARSSSWHVNWMGVLNHNYTLFEARATDGEIVMDATDGEGHPFQWIFYDIGENSFRWRAQSSADDGKTWTIAQRMTAVRR